MRPVRFTKAELALLRDLCDVCMGGTMAEEARTRRVQLSILAKLAAADEPAVTGNVSVAPIEEALLRTSRGKVVQLAGGPGYARASKVATAVGATVEDAEVLGAWLARQGWMREPTTLLGVLNKWAEWLPRARATAPPPAAQEGYGTGDTAPGARGPRGGGGGGGRGEGFR